MEIWALKIWAGNAEESVFLRTSVASKRHVRAVRQRHSVVDQMGGNEFTFSFLRFFRGFFWHSILKCFSKGKGNLIFPFRTGGLLVEGQVHRAGWKPDQARGSCSRTGKQGSSLPRCPAPGVEPAPKLAPAPRHILTSQHFLGITP